MMSKIYKNTCNKFNPPPPPPLTPPLPAKKSSTPLHLSYLGSNVLWKVAWKHYLQKASYYSPWLLTMHESGCVNRLHNTSYDV